MPEYEELRHYKVTRFRDARIGRETFEKPADLDRHLAESFGVFVESGDPVTVRVRFDASVTRFVEFLVELIGKKKRCVVDAVRGTSSEPDGDGGEPAATLRDLLQPDIVSDATPD